ncbi:MAG: hypothetical protein IJI84_00305 [Clostridia bacterium]|nr:hypothetical protein [Clostridia bacterium]
MKFKFLKIFFAGILVVNIFISNVYAGFLFFNVDIDGVRTTANICNENHHEIWSKIYLTPELLCGSSKKDNQKILRYLKTIEFKRINKKVYRKIKRYIRILRKIEKKSDYANIWRYDNIIFMTALCNI